jgi:hypothetical protein
MKSYLQACGVPTTRIGQVELPRLIMGIHPYDGCSYVDQERDAQNLQAFDQVNKVSEVLRYAVEDAGITVAQVDHMLPVLDRLHLQAIWETERLTGVQIGLVAYILIPIALDGQEIADSAQAYATLYAWDERVGGQAFREQIRQDEIVRYNLGGSFDGLVTPEIASPFTADEAARFEVDYARLERHLGFFAGCEILVADPGSEIDLLAMVGRFDLIREYLGFLRRRFPTVVTSVHHPGVTLPLLEAEGIDVDAYVTPVNRPGTMMFPTQEIALDAIRQASKPVIAIKPMAGGRYLGPEAFDFVFNEVGVAAAMFGMGTVQQARETTSGAKKVLGVA